MTWLRLLLQAALCAGAVAGGPSSLKRRLQATTTYDFATGYSGYSGSVTGSPGYSGYSGSVTGSPGYGGYGGNWVYCEEMYCYTNVYTETGEIDWDATSMNEPTCSTYDKGCTCNEQWEEECDSWGYKYCEQKSVGCFDPFDVTCMDYEVKCQDSFQSYCWDPSWGACPLYCNSTETYCYSYGYDVSGMMNYSDYHEYCAPADTGCTCNAKWEHKCTDQWGYSWCQEKTQACPITCGTDEQDCWMTPYAADGYPDWNASYNQTCHPIDQACPCHPVHEETCSDNWGTWCQSKVYGSCPVTCGADEMICWITPYDDSGNVLYDAMWNETCAPTSSGCPCNEKWEKQCTSYGYTFCEAKTNSCPVDCGEAATCYHSMSGNQTCATDSGCVCEANEISCSNPDTGMTECYPTDWYPSGCPVICKMSEMYCSNVSFDATTGMMSWQDYCLDGDSNNWMCPINCDPATSKKCGTPGSYDEHCVALSESCPLSCTAEQQYCWVDEYDAQGMWLSSSETCADMDADCPCGANAVQCEDPFYGGWKYCTAAAWGCPIYCDPITEKTCYPVSFTEDGLQDWNAPVQESCQNITQPCGCGENAKMCRWTDEWGYENEVCYPTSVACPVTCKEDEQRCYITDYESNGYPGVYRETCVKADQVCPCGSHSQQCHDPHWDYHYCYPLVDYWSNSSMRCPVYCTDEEDYCYSPSYDANGGWLSTVETCVPKGTKCQCTGQNSFSCDFNEWGYSWTECLPIEGGYCPPTCADGEVSCPGVDDYMPDGSWLGFSNPTTKCAADLDSCPCGTEAKACPGSSMRCIFKDEECPVVCGDKQKKCWITDFTQSGEYISDREICVGEAETCPCGQGTQRCPGEDICLLASEASLFCPCTESEKQCNVVDYTSSGKQTNTSVQCINKGAKCPCGANSLVCPDPNNAEENICRPKYAGTVLNSCPKACTPEQEAGGNRTCIQTHLTSTGAFRSESISCVAPVNCLAGDNMQKCPSGTHIPSWKSCKDLYGAGGSNASAIASGEKQKSKVIVVLDAVKEKAQEKLEDVRVLLNGELYLPKGLKSVITYKGQDTAVQGRRLTGRRASTAGAVLTLEIENEGVTSVAPVDVAQELQKQVKSSSTGAMKALGDLGTVNTKVGVRVASEKKTITTRADVANQQRKAALGISDPTTTTTTAGQGQGGQGGDSSTTTTAGDAGSSTTTTPEDGGLSYALPSHILNLFVVLLLALCPAMY